MVSNVTFRKLALSFPATVEQPHFEKASFRVNKKIFATLSEVKKLGVVKLSAIDQSVFCSYDKSVIYPVPGAWGKKGATCINLQKIKKEMLEDVLTRAYVQVAPTVLAEEYKDK